MAKKGKINLVFCIDESGSMTGSVNDVVGGFKNVIEEQKANKDGECVVSLYKFSSTVEEVFLGKSLDEIEELKYAPGGLTKLFDGVGTAIDNVGKWLDSMDEDDKPEKTLFVIMTDGEENSSTEYRASEVRDKIQHQTDKYSWTFIYLGNDLSDANDAKALNTAYRAFTSKKKFANNYNIVNEAASVWRGAAAEGMSFMAMETLLDEKLTTMANTVTEEYKADTGIDIS